MKEFVAGFVCGILVAGLWWFVCRIYRRDKICLKLPVFNAKRWLLATEPVSLSRCSCPGCEEIRKMRHEIQRELNR